MADLTDKQSAFVDQYFLCGFNATEAAFQAGYKGNRHTLSVVGAQNLVNTRIATVIAARVAERTMSAHEVLERYTEQARGSVAPFLEINDNGELVGFDFSAGKPLHLLKKATITETSIGKAVTKRTVAIEVLDPQAALFQLGKHHGLDAPTRVDHTLTLEKAASLTDDDLDALGRERGLW